MFHKATSPFNARILTSDPSSYIKSLLKNGYDEFDPRGRKGPCVMSFPVDLNCRYFGRQITDEILEVQKVRKDWENQFVQISRFPTPKGMKAFETYVTKSNSLIRCYSEKLRERTPKGVPEEFVIYSRDDRKAYRPDSLDKIVDEIQKFLDELEPHLSPIRIGPKTDGHYLLHVGISKKESQRYWDFLNAVRSLQAFGPWKIPAKNRMGGKPIAIDDETKKRLAALTRKFLLTVRKILGHNEKFVRNVAHESGFPNADKLWEYIHKRGGENTKRPQGVLTPLDFAAQQATISVRGNSSGWTSTIKYYHQFHPRRKLGNNPT